MDVQFPNGKMLRLVRGDITVIRVDAIVNAANSGLRGGGGVDGAIHRAGGPAIMKDLDEIRASQGGCPTGSAVATGAGALPAQYVFHAVGPIYRDGNHREAELLRSCYEASLALGEERGVRTISFPAIATGAYGYPMREAARIALEATGGHLARNDTGIREALFVLATTEAYEVHSSVLAALRAKRLK
ncbi:MAG: O-acetyl-ADP-ribose deacetylase [Bryobacteraceae bacterium]|jgi:O-acetyl-ADP-ribose deacetylase (regulator of RNase III)